MKRKLTVILIVLALAAAIALTVIHLLGQRTEYKLEMADLQGMRVAEAAAQLLWKDKLPEEPTEYWLDAGSFTLVPVDEPMTMVYGAGTEKAGGAMKDFEAETGKHYDYSETKSYKGMLIHVTVRDNEGTLQIDVGWVPVDLCTGRNGRMKLYIDPGTGAMLFSLATGLILEDTGTVPMALR